MPRTLLSCIIGFFSFFAWFLGAAIFEVPGQNSVQEIVAGAIALLLYIGLAQNLLPRDPGADAAEDWRVRGCMASPLVLFALLIVAAERRSKFFPQVTMLAAGCLGILLGGLLARSRPRSKQVDAGRAMRISKLLGNTGASLYAVVSLILFALVLPSVAKNISPQTADRSATRGILVTAVIHLLLAAAVFRRIRKGKAPIIPASFGFLMSLLLIAVGAAYIAPEPAMRMAAIAFFVCAAMNMGVCACCAGIAMQHPEMPPSGARIQAEARAGTGRS